MDDLLQKQIRDSCRLALPNGLQDLMSDISREVLRAQPQNLLQFITDYLAALLVTRENLFIASRVCDDACTTRCYPELEDELREVGLSDEDVEKTVKLVTDFFESGGVKETNLLIKLLKKTEIDETQLPAVLEAVRGAFRRHQVNNTVIYESSSTDSDMDETLIAAKHTLKLYRKAKKPDENYNCVVAKIQAAYRGFNVRRKFQRQNRERSASPPKTKTDATKKALHFDSKKVELLFPETPRSKRCSSKASSVSLAGSFVLLPPFKPYSIDDIFSEVDEISEKEKEHNSFDYTQNWKNAPEWNQEPGNKHKDLPLKKKIISFHDLPQIISKDSEEGDDEIPEEVEAAAEADDELEEVDDEFLQEQLIKDHELWPHNYTKPTGEKNEAKNNSFSDKLNKVLINEQVTRTPTKYEHVFMPKEEQSEAIDEDDIDITRIVTPLQTIIENSVIKLKKTSVVKHCDDDITDEKLINEQKTHESAVEEVTIEPQDENTEVLGREDDDVVNEELTHEPVQIAQMIEEQVMRHGYATELIKGNGDENIIEELMEENAEAEGNDDDDENSIKELINEPMIANVVEEELMWYGDGYDRMKENSECDSRDGGDDNILEYFEKGSAPASFTDLSAP